MVSADDPALRRHLTQDEGIKSFPYVDTAGKVTIGIGRNLTDVGLSPEEVDLLYQHDVIRAIAALTLNVPWWLTLDNVRQLVLVDLCFNLGIARLLMFPKFLRALQRLDYPTAAAELHNSLWAKQVGLRALRLEAMVSSGVDSYYA